MRFGRESLGRLPPGIGRPAYDRSRIATGIVHFGPGAFHRAHQADYVDRLLQQDPRWGIAAVSMRSAYTIEALRRQDGLYTLAILDDRASFRVIGAHSRLLGRGDDAAIRAQLAQPSVRLVSSTVTEKGYCLAGDGTLDLAHPDIVHDLARPDRPRSLIGWLALGLADRRAAGSPPFTPLCCDNMAANGRTLAAAVEAFARRIDPAPADWIAGEVRFPNTMVDSIAPATSDDTRRLVRAATGLEDAVPVNREAYAEWVIEDVLGPDAPDLAAVGATLTADVASHELAKLRILNGAHSTLAYAGLLRGHGTVAEAMADGPLARFVEDMVRREIIPGIAVPFDLHAYADQIFTRFRNPAIVHRLAQIAWDGSQKLPYRLLATITEAIAQHRPFARLTGAVAAWMLFVERQGRAGIPLVDPLADALAAIGREGPLAERLLDETGMFPPTLWGNDRFRTALIAQVAALRAEGPEALWSMSHA